MRVPKSALCFSIPYTFYQCEASQERKKLLTLTRKMKKVKKLIWYRWEVESCNANSRDAKKL